MASAASVISSSIFLFHLFLTSPIIKPAICFNSVSQLMEDNNLSTRLRNSGEIPASSSRTVSFIFRRSTAIFLAIKPIGPVRRSFLSNIGQDYYRVFKINDVSLESVRRSVFKICSKILKTSGYFSFHQKNDKYLRRTASSQFSTFFITDIAGRGTN